MASSKKYPYDVALSYAGEDRDHAETLANTLKQLGVKVFYDQYEKPFLWGKDLYTHLSDVYKNKATYCVIFISQYYASKVWTKHELKAAQDRALKESDEYILPIRLDNTEIPGIFSTTAYLDWKQETVQTIAETLLSKLDKKSIAPSITTISQEQGGVQIDQVTSKRNLKPDTRPTFVTPATVYNPEFRTSRAKNPNKTRPWSIEENEFDPKNLHSCETVYTIGNGYFGTRGTFEEGYPKATPGTLLFGVFDKVDTAKEELANAPDWLSIKLFVNGERFRLDQGKILDYHRTLDMQHGILRRMVRWESPGGIRIRITSERFASLADEHVGVIRYSLTAEEQPETGGKLDVFLWSALDMAVGNYDLIHWEPVEQRRDGELLWLHAQTRHSSVQLVQTMSFSSKDCAFQKELNRSDSSPSIRIYKELAIGETMTAEKVVVMYTSRDVEDPLQTAIEHHHTILQSSASSAVPGKHYTVLVDGARYVNPCVQVEPFETLLAEHEQAWQNYWQVSDVIIEGDDKAQQAIRYNIYQLRISASSHDNRYSIAAKGLTGFGYSGHVFHDTEIFMLPYFTYVHSDIARNLLIYRYRLLPTARAKAKSNGYDGAQYPWESTLDGEETAPSAIVHPETGELIPVLNGQIELHITASISHGVWQYWQVTGDDEFMRDYGAEMILSTAEFWASRAEWNPENSYYEINNVIGPDEWHEHVNNNVYTNYMARWNIQIAIDVLHWLRSNAPDKAKELAQRLDLNEKRLARWHDVKAHIRIPHDKRTGLFEQFDGFFRLEPFDQEKYQGRTASYQGLLGMKVVQYYQIIKQADVLMLLTVLNQQFNLKTKKVNWDYYYPITDHDYGDYGSPLTPAFHVILACELGLVDTAYKMFMKGALVDIEDQRRNSDLGIHEACAGAVWQAAILGFAGLRFTNDGYTTTPSWPDGWTRLAFKCFYKGKEISIDLRRS